MDAAAALAAAGQLSAQRPAGVGAAPAANFGGGPAAVPPEVGAAPAVNFGGGPAAVPPEPVRPRGSGQLVLFAILALTALVLVMAAVSRLAVLSRMRRREQEPADRPPPCRSPRPAARATRFRVTDLQRRWTTSPVTSWTRWRRSRPAT